MWMDHGAGKEAAAINATGDPALAYVGGEVSLEIELPKVLWLMRRFADRYARTARFFDLADYMVWRCTGHDVASVCTRFSRRYLSLDSGTRFAFRGAPIVCGLKIEPEFRPVTDSMLETR
jgi:ribulose kinase